MSSSSLRKWKTLRHGGVSFPSKYRPHGVPLLYNGRKRRLSPRAEEMASHYARVMHRASPTFRRNFFADFAPVAKVKSLSQCDFSLIRDHLEASVKAKHPPQNTIKRNVWVDGRRYTLPTIRVDGPGLFHGRGNHPKTGAWRRRIMPEDVTLNLDATAPIPPCPLKGHRWKRVIHNPHVSWIAAWQDPVMCHQPSDDAACSGKGWKYIRLPQALLSDCEKFDSARRLGKHINRIRTQYRQDWNNTDDSITQRAIIMYLLDRLALRIGGRKGGDRTYGASTLLSKHVAVGRQTGKQPHMTLDFPGKDSIRFHCTVRGVPTPVWRGMRRCKQGKASNEAVFDKVSVEAVDRHLKSIMPGLSAKVFRTYRASETLQRHLSNTKPTWPLERKLSHYHAANVKVARLLNHVSMDKVAPNTSKTYYSDPRITVAWAKRHKVPIARLFSPALERRHTWAMSTPASWRF